MAEGNVTPYNTTKRDFFNGSLDWDTDTYYCHLLKNTYTPAATHDTWSDVSAQECTDGDYAAQLMSGESVSGGTATATAALDASNVSFGTNVTISARYFVIRKGTATPGATDPILFYGSLDTATDVTSTNGNFEVQWNGSGLITIS